MLIKVSRKKFSTILILPVLFLLSMPAMADDGAGPGFDQTSDLIQQADNMDNSDLSQVHVDNGKGATTNGGAGMQLSDQEREVYQHAQDQYEEEQVALKNNTKHIETPSIITPDRTLTQADDDIEKYRVEAQSNDRLIQEN